MVEYVMSQCLNDDLSIRLLTAVSALGIYAECTIHLFSSVRWRTQRHFFQFLFHLFSVEPSILRGLTQRSNCSLLIPAIASAASRNEMLLA